MPALLILLVAGLAMLIIGNAMTRTRIRSTWGRIDETTINLSQGTGVVPSWISLLMLLAWTAIVIGGIGAIIAAVS